jgi:hypothetical protein
MLVAPAGARSLSNRVKRTQAKTPLAEVEVENYEIEDEEAATTNPQESPQDRDS